MRRWKCYQSGEVGYSGVHRRHLDWVSNFDHRSYVAFSGLRKFDGRRMRDLHTITSLCYKIRGNGRAVSLPPTVTLQGHKRSSCPRI